MASPTLPSPPSPPTLVALSTITSNTGGRAYWEGLIWSLCSSFIFLWPCPRMSGRRLQEEATTSHLRRSVTNLVLPPQIPSPSRMQGLLGGRCAMALVSACLGLGAATTSWTTSSPTNELRSPSPPNPPVRADGRVIFLRPALL
jgi:hypothetical protein